MKNRGVAIVLALFLGPFGIHRFYVGQIAWGFIFLIFCWTFIPAIFGIIDVFRWAFMKEETFQARYSTPSSTVHSSTTL